eukprot:1161847-Pelagomonas_calceolata.AAC.7
MCGAKRRCKNNWLLFMRKTLTNWCGGVSEGGCPKKGIMSPWMSAGPIAMVTVLLLFMLQPCVCATGGKLIRIGQQLQICCCCLQGLLLQTTVVSFAS